MDFNEYALEQLVRDRLEALRAAAARQSLAPPRPPRASLRERVGRALIRVGGWLVAKAPRAAADARPR